MSSDTPRPPETVIACDPTPITPAQRERWLFILNQMYRATQEIRELPDGYALRLPPSAEMLLLVAEDLTMERLCCPFVRYSLEVEPYQGPFWLSMTGGAGVKEFLRTAFESGDLFAEPVARAAGFEVSARASLDSVAATLETIDAFNARYAASVTARDGQA
jgi:hypothetical protein